MQILERPEDIQKQAFEDEQFELCDTWDAYTAGVVLNQIDSGL
jgi:hypothetical protein